jgi:S-methylmethionine-dependent homocysteine/selenocysteine methylase
MLSLYCTDQLRLLSGEHLQDYLPKYTATYKPQLISFNCIPVSTMQKIVQEIKLDFPWGSYVNCGQCSEVHMDLDYTVTP